MKLYTVKQIKSFYNDEKKESDSTLPFFHRNVVRPISFYFSVPLLYLGFSANQVSFLSLVFSLIGNFQFTIGSYWNMSLGVILIIFAIVFDFVDGNIARFKNESSQYGKFLDGTFGFIMYALIPICLSIGLSKNISETIWLGISEDGFVLIGASLTITYMFVNYIQWRLKAQSTINNSVRENEGLQMEATPKRVGVLSSQSIKNILNAIETINAELFIPSFILILINLPFVMFVLYSFSLISSSIIIVLRTFRKAYNDLG